MWFGSCRGQERGVIERQFDVDVLTGLRKNSDRDAIDACILSTSANSSRLVATVNGSDRIIIHLDLSIRFDPRLVQSYIGRYR
jgi:hypothetical protein